MSQDRTLRVVTLCASALATPLLIGCTIASLENHRYYRYWERRRVSAFCFAFIPLALTAAVSGFSLAYHRRHGRMPNYRLSIVDLVAACTYLGLLIPIWATEVRNLQKSGLGLLAGYTTAPMIVNMIVHFYIFVCNAQFLYTWLMSKREHECPNCHSKFTVAAPQVQQTSKGGEGYSLLRGEDYLDEDAVAYNDGRTSEEQVGTQSAPDVEDKGKGTIKI
jgi:hypothetical protein